MAFTAESPPVVLDVLPVTSAAFSGITMDHFMCASLCPHPLLVEKTCAIQKMPCALLLRVMNDIVMKAILRAAVDEVTSSIAAQAHSCLSAALRSKHMYIILEKL